MTNIISRHERRLEQCTLELAAFCAAKTGKEEEISGRQAFSTWVEANAATASELAGDFLLDYIAAKSVNVSVGHTVRLYIQAWSELSIRIPAGVVAKIVHHQRTSWHPARAQRLNEYSIRKTAQYETLDKHWNELIKYLASTQPSVFAEHLRQVADNRAMYKGIIAESSFQEMSVLSRKSEAELSRTLLRTKAFISLLRATGMRGNTAVTLTLEQLTRTEGGVLLHRLEKKSGSVRNIQKPVYVCLVPHKDPQLDPLVHLAEYLGDDTSDGQPFFFAQGFKQRPKQCVVSFTTMVQRRFIAVLHAVAIGVGIPKAFTEKKLHSLRVLCTNVLSAKGATAAEREAHIGWTSTTQTKYYTSLKHRALNARTPYLLADRANKDDPPHPMWDLLDEVPLTAGQSYWAKVRYIAAAAGFISGVTVDTEFAARMDKHLEHQNNERRPDAGALAKRVRELESELARANKRAKTQAAATTAPTTPSPAAGGHLDKLKALVIKLKEKASADDFPVVCGAALPRFVQLIDTVSTRGGFGLPQSTSLGKDLIRLLVLAGAVHRFGPGVLDRGVHSSWLGWLRTSRSSNQHTNQITTSSWAKYKQAVFGSTSK